MLLVILIQSIYNNTGDKNLAVTALNMNPLCQSDADANIVVEELIKAHQEYLPQFNHQN